MRFITIREFRTNSEKLREYLNKDGNVILRQWEAHRDNPAGERGDFGR